MDDSKHLGSAELAVNGEIEAHIDPQEESKLLEKVSTARIFMLPLLRVLSATLSSFFAPAMPPLPSGSSARRRSALDARLPLPP